MMLTYRYRLRDGAGSTRRALRKQASAVNFVWNYCCQIQREAERKRAAGLRTRWPTPFDLQYLTTGCTAELGLASDTISAVCRSFVAARKKSKHCPAWRSARKNLDWIPITHASDAVRIEPGRVKFRKRYYYLWWSRDLPTEAKAKTAAFSCDSRGRWYFNLTIEIPVAAAKDGPAVGIDLGLKHLATLSDGRKIETPAFYRKSEGNLARYQRFGLKKRVTALSAKVANQRKHFLHVVSAGLVRDYARIVVGDVSPSQLGKGPMAKSIYDAGWTTLREHLRYKAIKHGVAFEVVDERMTSRTCSACGSIPASSPQGRGALGVREWTCDDCGAVHDRDVNAARNILLGAKCRPQADGIASRAGALTQAKEVPSP